MQRRKKAEGFDDFEEHETHGETLTHEEHSDSEDSYQPENHDKQTEEHEEEDDIEYVQTYEKKEVEKTDANEEETDEKEEKIDGKNEGFRGRGKGRYNRGRGRGRGRGGRFQRQKGFEKKYKKISNNAEETQKSDADKTSEDGDKKKVYNNYKKQRYDGQFNRGRGRVRGRGGRRLVKKYVPKTDDTNEDVQPTTENRKTHHFNQYSHRGGYRNQHRKVIRYSERRRQEFKQTQDATNQTNEAQNGVPQKGYQGMYVPPVQYDYYQYPQMYGQGQFIPVMGVVPPVVYDTYGQQVYGNNQYYNPYQYPPYQMTNYGYVKPKVLPPSESKLNVNAPIFNPSTLQTTETKQEKIISDEKKDSS